MFAAAKRGSAFGFLSAARALKALHYKRAAFTLSELSRKYATIWGR